MFSTLYGAYIDFKYTLKCRLQFLSIWNCLKIFSSGNGLTNDSFLDFSNLKEIEDDNMSVVYTTMYGNHRVKLRKFWLPAFSTFFTMFLKRSLKPGMLDKGFAHNKTIVGAECLPKFMGEADRK